MTKPVKSILPPGKKLKGRKIVVSGASPGASDTKCLGINRKKTNTALR